MLHTPLTSIHQEYRAKMHEFAGYLMPISYESGILKEHLHTREQASLFDVSHMGHVFIPQDKDWETLAEKLEHLVPSDIKSLNPFEMRYSVLLNEAGGIVDDLMIIRLGTHEGILLIINAGCRNKDIQHVKTHFSSHLNIDDTRALLALQGPQAHKVLANYIPDLAALPFLQARYSHLFDTPILLMRSGYTGEDGFEISLPAENAALFATALLKHDSVKWAGLGARDSLRLEAGLPLYGHELNETISPITAGIGWVIPPHRREHLDCIGAARLKEELTTPPPQKRVGFILEERAVARENTLIFNKDHQQIGIVTSGGFSPSLNKSIGMGLIDRNYVDDILYLQIREKLYLARKASLPFIRPRYYRVK